MHFLINVFTGTKYFLSVLETVGIRVPTRNIGKVTMFSCSFSHCHSAVCVSAANEFVNLQILLVSRVWMYKALADLFFFVLLFFYIVLCCLIAAVVCICADSVIDHWLSSSAHKYTKNWIELLKGDIEHRRGSVYQILSYVQCLFF
jgi:hypothetical protein